MSPLECKCLLCYLIHFHWVHSFSGNRFRGLFFSFLPRSTCTMGCHTSEGWSGSGRDGIGWGGGVFKGLDCSMWSKRGS